MLLLEFLRSVKIPPVGYFTIPLRHKELQVDSPLGGNLLLPSRFYNQSVLRSRIRQSQNVHPISSDQHTINNGGNNPTISWNTAPIGITGSLLMLVLSLHLCAPYFRNFNYTHDSFGTCINSSLSGTIIVNPGSSGLPQLNSSASLQMRCAILRNLSNTNNWPQLSNFPSGSPLINSGKYPDFTIQERLQLFVAISILQQILVQDWYIDANY
jgi:hypothetical protein